MDTGAEKPAIGRSILALIMILVALLGWMLAAATVLVSSVEGARADWFVVWCSLPLGSAYLLLAWAIARQRAWALPLAFLLLCAVLSVGIADLERPGLMALDSSLTLLMAAVASMVAIVALSFPVLDRVVQDREAERGEAREP